MCVMQVVDVDGDGDLDVVPSFWLDDASDMILPWAENTGNATHHNWTWRFGQDSIFKGKPADTRTRPSMV